MPSVSINQVPVIPMTQVVNEFAAEIKSWVERKVFRDLVDLENDAATDLYQRAQNLTDQSLDADFEAIVEALQNLKGKKKLFSESKPYLYLYLRIVAARACVYSLANSGAPATSISPFKMVKVDFELYNHPVHISDNASHQQSYFAYIDFSIVDESALTIAINNASTELPFKLLTASQDQGKIVGAQVVFIDKGVNIPNERIKFFAQMALAHKGLSFHKRATYSGFSAAKAELSVDINEAYEQFDDVLEVLSQVNHDEDLLDKFLRFYQILENFMVRQQVVTVQRATGADKFSIRNFRTLYKHVETYEANALEDLVKCTLTQITQQIGPKTLKNHISDRWDQLLIASTHIPDLEKNIGEVCGSYPKKQTRFNSAEFKKSLCNVNISGALADMIYRVRNSIVHNKEHEFHLTHFNLTSHVKDLLDTFLIPSMEDLIYVLILQDKNLVWYASPVIKLYG